MDQRGLLKKFIYQLYLDKAGREGKVNIFKHQNHYQFKRRRRRKENNEKEYILEKREGTSRKVLLGEIINGNLLGIILSVNNSQIIKCLQHSWGAGC